MPASPSGPAQPTVPSSLLWAHILRRPRPPTAPPPRANLTPADKAKAATRILLHDTQSRLETFAKTAEGLLNETRRGRVEVERVRDECAGAGAGEKTGDEVVGALNRVQGAITKVVGEPAQAKNVDSLAANVAGLGKLVDAQTHILTAIQSCCGIPEHQIRWCPPLDLRPLLALPAAIDALSLRLATNRISPITSSSPRSTTSSDAPSSSASADSSTSPKRAHEPAEPRQAAEVGWRIGSADTVTVQRFLDYRRDIDAIFPLPPSAQRP
ncbi:unnamed protein product [Peniophora sp. CBMAI 1063]|nr:unnamed protein product [Peniophora sp. CBMAI 1063]